MQPVQRKACGQALGSVRYARRGAPGEYCNHECRGDGERVAIKRGTRPRKYRTVEAALRDKDGIARIRRNSPRATLLLVPVPPKRHRIADCCLTEEGHACEQHVRSHSRVRAVQIGVGNMVVLVAQIHGDAATRVEQLHATSELHGKVELLLCFRTSAG